MRDHPDSDEPRQDPRVRFAILGGSIGVAISLGQAVSNGTSIELVPIIAVVAGVLGLVIGWIGGWVVKTFGANDRAPH